MLKLVSSARSTDMTNFNFNLPRYITGRYSNKLNVMDSKFNLPQTTAEISIELIRTDDYIR